MLPYIYIYIYIYMEANYPFFWQCDDFVTFNGLKPTKPNQFKEYK